VMEAEGQRVSEMYGLGIDFDINSAAAQDWLKSYVPMFASELEKVGQDQLRDILIQGLESGATIPELIKSVSDVFGDWSVRRAEMVARTEIIRASNMGNVQTYLQSGVVKTKIWVATFDRRTCPACEGMDGQAVSIEQPFFEMDVPYAIPTGGGNTESFTTNYDVIQAPPLHSSCRCAVAPSMEPVSRYYGKKLWNDARGAEVPITWAMKAAAREGGTRLARLDFRIKEQYSIERKLGKWLDDDPLTPTWKSAANLQDTVRYTVIGDEVGFADAINKMHATLQADGFEFLRVTNYYGKPGAYQGINAKYIDPKTGLPIEVQFHSKTSLKIADKNHLLYEKERLSRDAAEKLALNQEMANNWIGFRMPDGATTLFKPGG